MRKIDADLERQQGELEQQMAKSQMSDYARETLSICIGDAIDDFKAIAQQTSKQLENVVPELENGSKRLKSAVNEVSSTSSDIKNALNEVLRLTKDLALTSADTYKEQIKTLEDRKAELTHEVHKLEKDRKKTLMQCLLISSVIALITLFVGYNLFHSAIEDYYADFEVSIQDTITEWELALNKRKELTTPEAWQEYYDYCIKTYVKCPFFGDCVKERELYTNEFIRKFGNKPTIEGAE